MKILHVITDLSTGGAEMMLYRLLSNIERNKFQSEVVSLTDIGPLGKKIQKLGITVGALGMQRGVPNPLQVIKLARWMRKSRPDLVQTWMYHADLIGGIAAKLAGRVPVVWNIRHGTFDYQIDKFSTILTAKVCAALSSRLPQQIVCCAKASEKIHVKIGYPQEKITVIPNGIDLDTYRPIPSLKQKIRDDLGIPHDAFVIGLVGRFHPQKDHRNFLDAASIFSKQIPHAYFLICGNQINWENAQLVSWIREASLENRIQLLNEQEDIPAIYNACDIACSSSSYGEGFPTVVGEAMACGLPCAVTDVGDSSEIVGNTGRVVIPRDPAELAKAWLYLFEIGPAARYQLGQEARKRVEEYFNVHQIVLNYENLYDNLISELNPKLLPAGKKQALMVSYTFPPFVAGGSVRIKNFTTHLPDYGWKCHILTVKVPSEMKAADPEGMSKDSVVVHRALSLDPFRATRGVARGLHETAQHRILQWLSSFFLVPDRQILWAPFALIKAIQIMKRYDCDVIYSTFGPASNHLVAWMLKCIFRKPWVADFRDLWVMNRNLIVPSPLHGLIHAWLEKLVVRTADRIVGVGEHINNVLKQHAQDDAKFVTISNGYDGELVRLYQNNLQAPSQNCFSIVYTGSFYRKRSPEAFLDAIKELVENGKIPLEDIKINFVSNFKVSKQEYATLQPALEMRGLTSHEEALAAMAKATVFLLVVEDELKLQIVNAKLFDYMAFHKPILALVEEGSVCLPYLIQSGLAVIAKPTDKNQIIEKIYHLYSLWKKGELKIFPHEEYIEQFEINFLTSRLSAVLHDVTVKSPRRELGEKMPAFEPIAIEK